MRDPFDEAKFYIKDPKFKMGDQVFQQWPLTPQLLMDAGKPYRLTVLGYALVDEKFPSRGGNLVEAYITSWNHQPVPASLLFRTVEEFEEANATVLAERRDAAAKKVAEDRIKKYKEAKQVVTDFEAKYFTRMVEL